MFAPCSLPEQLDVLQSRMVRLLSLHMLTRLDRNTLKLQWELVNPNQKEPNRAVRAIRTAKNHIVATRAWFHRDCPHTYSEKCLSQMKLTLNCLHPYA
jgi:hypothetical protein